MHISQSTYNTRLTSDKLVIADWLTYYLDPDSGSGSDRPSQGLISLLATGIITELWQLVCVCDGGEHCPGVMTSYFVTETICFSWINILKHAS